MGAEERDVWQQLESENATQLRLGIWNRIRQLLDRAHQAEGRVRSECAQAAESHLRLLGPWERYWLYPGATALQRLLRLVQAGQLDDAAGQARSITYLLGELGDRALVLLDGTGAHERYFTTLLVDGDSRRRSTELGRSLRAERRADDRRAYRLLAVDSIEDALCALACNDAIEACVLAAPVPWRGRESAPWLGAALHRELLRLAATDERPMHWLPRRLAGSHPHLQLFEWAPPAELHQQLVACGSQDALARAAAL